VEVLFISARRAGTVDTILFCSYRQQFSRKRWHLFTEIRDITSETSSPKLQT